MAMEGGMGTVRLSQKWLFKSSDVEGLDDNQITARNFESSLALENAGLVP
jgi:hypothetical protein